MKLLAFTLKVTEKLLLSKWSNMTSFSRQTIVFVPSKVTPANIINVIVACLLRKKQIQWRPIDQVEPDPALSVLYVLSMYLQFFKKRSFVHHHTG